MAAFSLFLAGGPVQVERLNDFVIQPFYLRRDGDSNPRILGRGLTVFETAAFDHSAISPIFLRCDNRFVSFLLAIAMAFEMLIILAMPIVLLIACTCKIGLQIYELFAIFGHASQDCKS